jgi:hypothetical protein
MGRCVLDSSDVVYGSVVGTFKAGIEPGGSI